MEVNNKFYSSVRVLEVGEWCENNGVGNHQWESIASSFHHPPSLYLRGFAGSKVKSCTDFDLREKEARFLYPLFGSRHKILHVRKTAYQGEKETSPDIRHL